MRKQGKKTSMHILKSVFAVLSVINIMVISYLLLPGTMRNQVFPLIAVLAFASMFIGIALNSLVIKYHVKGRLALFLIMVGTSSIGVLMFSILHNIFYAFAGIFAGVAIIKIIFDFLSFMSFIIGLMICPIAFVVGAIGSLMMFRKK